MVWGGLEVVWGILGGLGVSTDRFKGFKRPYHGVKG